MTSYRRQVHHPLAVEPAVRQVRRHAWETPGFGEGYAEETVKNLIGDFRDRFITGPGFTALGLPLITKSHLAAVDVHLPESQHCGTDGHVMVDSENCECQS